jgi:purine-nucleoside phosphorylase
VKTLVVSAWEPEIAPLRRLLGRVPPGAVVLRPVGVGLVEAAVGAARALAEVRPKRVIFVGTAGAYLAGRSTPALGSVALASELILTSTAALRGDGYLPEIQPQHDDGAETLRAALREAVPGIATFKVACPLAITRTAALGQRIARATGAGLENLEAFAVARAARAAQVPFAAVLGIANRVGPAAHRQWRANHLTASRAASRIVARLLIA